MRGQIHACTHARAHCQAFYHLRLLVVWAHLRCHASPALTWASRSLTFEVTLACSPNMLPRNRSPSCVSGAVTACDRRQCTRPADESHNGPRFTSLCRGASMTKLTAPSGSQIICVKCWGGRETVERGFALGMRGHARRLCTHARLHVCLSACAHAYLCMPSLKAVLERACVTAL